MQFILINSIPFENRAQSKACFALCVIHTVRRVQKSSPLKPYRLIWSRRLFRRQTIYADSAWILCNKIELNRSHIKEINISLD